MPDAFVRRDALAHKLQQLFSFHWLTQHDDSLRHLARFIIGIRNHRGVRYTRMSQQHRFEFGRRHLETLVLDQLLRTIDDEEVPVFVYVTDVASVQPTFPIDGPSGRFRFVQVSFHDLWTTHTDLALLSRTERLTTFEIDNLALRIRR